MPPDIVVGRATAQMPPDIVVGRATTHMSHVIVVECAEACNAICYRC